MNYEYRLSQAVREFNAEYERALDAVRDHVLETLAHRHGVDPDELEESLLEAGE